MCEWCGKKIISGEDGWVWSSRFCNASCKGKYFCVQRMKNGTFTGFGIVPGLAEKANKKSYEARMKKRSIANG